AAGRSPTSWREARPGAAPGGPVPAPGHLDEGRGMTGTDVPNYVNGAWCRSAAAEHLAVTDPATAEVLGRVPLSPAAGGDQAVPAAGRAFPDWRRVPVTERVQYLFRLKGLLEDRLEDLARTVTRECGKTLAEARGELRRGIENVEAACGMPSLMQGWNNED